MPSSLFKCLRATALAMSVLAGGTHSAAAKDLLKANAGGDAAVIRCCGKSENCLERLTRNGDSVSAACAAVLGTGFSYSDSMVGGPKCPFTGVGPVPKGNLFGAPSIPNPPPGKDRFAEIRNDFCAGDAYDAVCANADTIQPPAEFAKALRDIKAAALSKAGPKPKTEQFHVDYNQESVNWLARVESGVFDAQLVKAAPGNLTFPGPLNEGDLKRFMAFAKQGVAESVDQLTTKDKAELKKTLSKGGYLSHSSVQQHFLSVPGNAKSAAVDEYKEGEEVCGVDGLESNGYKNEGNFTLCPGAWASVFAAFRDGDAPIPENLIRLGVLGKMAHEASHSIDPGNTPASTYREYTACLASRYPGGVGSKEDIQKEIFADHMGAEVLGNALSAADSGGADFVALPSVSGPDTSHEALTIKNKIKVLFSNYRELCSKSDPKLIPEFRARFAEIAGNPSMRNGLRCPSVAPPANYCKP